MPETNQRSNVSAVVLAAGMSTRMGAIKQLLQIGDRTLLECVLANLRQSSVAEIIVVLGEAADEIRQRVRLENVRIVVNQAYREGMGTSLRLGLAHVDPQAEAALVVLADQPFVQPRTMDHLIEQYRARRPQIAIPMYRGFRGNPVLLDRSVLPELESLTGDIGCRAIFGAHTENILKVPVDDAGVLVDVDTKADLERLQQPRAPADWAQTLIETADQEDRNTGAPQLVVVGEDAVTKALAQIGRILHFSVTIIDPFLKIAEVPGAGRILHALDFARLPASTERYVVVASRGRFDEEAVEQALRTGAKHVALMANKARAREIRNGLMSRGLSDEQLSQVRAPAGLDIGAHGPEEIALSVMAEIVSVRATAHRIP
jgi:molybdenum cofactor cytidylyltransferase